MYKVKEYPRGGVANKIIENKAEMHLPCVVLLDTSSSMRHVQEQLKEGLNTLVSSLNSDAQGRVEFSVIAFDDKARIIEPFGPTYDFETPNIDCDGMTAMHDAVDLGLSEIEARKTQYKEKKVPYYRPWIFLLSDGEPTDRDNGAFERLIESQKGKHCIFYPVAIGEEANTDLLKSLNKDGLVLIASKENFIGAFEWFSNSLSRSSGSIRGQEIELDNPGNYQLKVEV